MKVEFTAPEILKGESINSQLGWFCFFFSFFPLRNRRKCEWAQGCSQGFGGISLLVGTNRSLCLGGDRAARSALLTEPGWFVSGRTERYVCLRLNWWVSVSGPMAIPRKNRKRCCKSCVAWVCKTTYVYIGHQGMLLLFLIFASVSESCRFLCIVGLSHHNACM